MTHSTLWLAQIQFFSSFGFMLLFLVLEFGLAWVLLFFRIKAAGAHGAPWMAAYRFWVRVFALAFILGFAAAFPVLIQFGSIWPDLLGKIGDVAGPLIAAGVLSTFIFKSCFLGAMLFGLRRLTATAHILVVAMVAVGVSLSSFCLLALVSWTHTPSGATLVNGQYVIDDAMQVLFSPALPWYAGLFVTVSMLAVAFLMMAVVVGQSARNPASESYRLVFRAALTVALAGVVLHPVFFWGTAQLATQYQPAKAAAVAAYWESGSSPDLVVAAWPDAVAASNRLAWSWRGRASFLVASDSHGGWRGLDQFSGMAPPVALTFWSFRIVVLTGLLMAIMAVVTFLRVRGHRYDPSILSRRWCRSLKLMGTSGGIMLLAGMAYVQFGVFPYAVYGTVTLSEVVAPVSLLALVTTNVVYAGCYLALGIGFFHLLRYISRYGVIPVGRRRGRA